MQPQTNLKSTAMKKRKSPFDLSHVDTWGSEKNHAHHREIVITTYGKPPEELAPAIELTDEQHERLMRKYRALS
jgi:hypothetical protein